MTAQQYANAPESFDLRDHIRETGLIVLHDGTLDFRARGVFAFICSVDPEYHPVTFQALMVASPNDNEHDVDIALKELCDARHLRIEGDGWVVLW